MQPGVPHTRYCFSSVRQVAGSRVCHALQLCASGSISISRVLTAAVQPGLVQNCDSLPSATQVASFVFVQVLLAMWPRAESATSRVSFCGAAQTVLAHLRTSHLFSVQVAGVSSVQAVIAWPSPFFETAEFGFGSTLLIAGTHTQEIGTRQFGNTNMGSFNWNGGKEDNKGNNYVSDDMVSKAWDKPTGFSNLGRATSGSAKYGDNYNNGHPQSISWVWVDWTSGTYHGEAKIIGGQGNIAVDVSRHANLSTVPQLRALNYVTHYWHEDAGRYSPQEFYPNQAYISPWTYGNSGTGDSNPNQYYSNEMAYDKGSNALNWTNRTHSAGKNGDWPVYADTTVQVTRRDKHNLRKALQKKIWDNVQLSNYKNPGNYKAAIERLAWALCQPTYSFVISAGTDTYNTDVGDRSDPGSMASNIETYKSTLVTDGPFTAEEYYRSSTTGMDLLPEPNTRIYYPGNSVYARYNRTASFTGYKTVPIRVSLPGSIAPGTPGYPQGGTDETFAAASTNVDGGINPNPPPGYPTGSVPGEGWAPDSMYAINKNVQLKEGLKWIWWMEPIQYAIEYLPGDHGIGSSYKTLVKWDEYGTLGSNGFLPASGWRFVGWQFNGALRDPGYKFINLTSTAYDPATGAGVITATAIWERATAEPREILVDVNGATVSSYDSSLVTNVNGTFTIKTDNFHTYSEVAYQLPTDMTKHTDRRARGRQQPRPSGLPLRPDATLLFPVIGALMPIWWPALLIL